MHTWASPHHVTLVSTSPTDSVAVTIATGTPTSRTTAAGNAVLADDTEQIFYTGLAPGGAPPCARAFGMPLPLSRTLMSRKLPRRVAGHPCSYLFGTQCWPLTKAQPRAVTRVRTVKRTAALTCGLAGTPRCSCFRANSCIASAVAALHRLRLSPSCRDVPIASCYTYTGYR